jgi:hypothetical protein
MKPRCGKIWLTIAVCLFGLPQIAAAQPSAVANRLASNSCARGSSSGMVTVNSAQDPQSLVFESSMGAVKERPKIFTLPKIRTLLTRL